MNQYNVPLAPLGMVIVIPCYNEPDLLRTLQSLWDCERPFCAIDVIVVVNAAENSLPEVHARNCETLEKARLWRDSHFDGQLRFDFLDHQLPPKYAGVGLARRLGMDEAYQRLKPEGVIVSLDADCTVAPNYLSAIESHFQRYPETPGASIYFEHPLSGLELPAVYDAIIRYELFLRYYIQGLRFSGLPSAYHTLGSCMAVRAGVYRKQGGMNRRKAGEDFYFLHKIIPLGHFSEINHTVVYPSPRISDRVPFGTGAAVSKWLAAGMEDYPVYHPQIFQDLKLFLSSVTQLYSLTNMAYFLESLPISMRKFLALYNFSNKLQEIKQNSASEKAFIKRFWQWFDGFMAMKCVHFLRGCFYPQAPLVEAASQLWGWQTGEGVKGLNRLLDVYRQCDRGVHKDSHNIIF